MVVVVQMMGEPLIEVLSAEKPLVGSHWFRDHLRRCCRALPVEVVHAVLVMVAL